MTEIQVGKVMLTPKGEYDSTKTYIRLDAVTYQGSSYVCLADTSTTPPGDSWQLLADKGADGQPGKDGQPGSPGVTPHIDATTGNWFIGTTNTGVKAQGPAGQNGSDGKPGSNGSDGKPGADGVTPHIDSATGHWFIGSTDTGVSARGPQGEQGSPGKDGQTPDVSNLATKTDLANYYTKTETDTKLSTKADQAEYQTLNDKFSNMQIGGRNLYIDTKSFDSPASWYVGGPDPSSLWTKTTDTYNGLAVIQATQDWNGLSQYIQVKKGDVLTYSVYAKNTSGTGTSTIFWLLNFQTEGSYSTATVDPANTPVAITGSWQRVSSTAVATSDGYLRPRIERTNNNTNTLQIAGIKVEKGSIATDWTPAPEDTTTAIQKNTTAIGQANQQITDLQTAVKAQQSAAIDTSNVSTSKKPSDYSDGIFYELKSVSTLGLDRSGIASELQQGTNAIVTTKAYSGMARQMAEVIGSATPATFIRNGNSTNWSNWYISQLTAM